MTSLAYIFTMEKALVKTIFGHQIFICQPIKNLWHLLRLMGCKRIVRLHFACDVSGHGDMQNSSL